VPGAHDWGEGPIEAHLEFQRIAADAIPVRPRASRTPERLVSVAGRAACVILPVAVTAAWVDGSAASRWVALMSVLWIVTIQRSFELHGGELFPLGAAAAAARGVCVGLVVVSATSYWLGNPMIRVGPLLLCSLSIFVLLIAWQRFVARAIVVPQRVLILGSGTQARDLIEAVRIEGKRPFELVGMVHDSSAFVADDTETVGSLESLPALMSSIHPEIVVMALERNRPTAFRELLAAADYPFQIVEAAQFYEYAFGRVPIRDLQYPWFVGVLHLYRRPYSRSTKRLFDLIVSCTGLLFVAPFLPLVVLAVLTSRGPVLIKQIRVGENGKVFTILKFRTMRADAEQNGAQWSGAEDARITLAGRFLRRTRLDELPQLVNVLRGEMSIVGPRPERPEFMDVLEERVPYWSRRNLVKPGITGWAQIRHGYTSDSDGALDKLSYDLWYLRHRTLFVDVVICFKTLGVIVAGGPLVTPMDVVADDTTRNE
jgi:exopolysaccharide biosynthesis polyprenyl glycosylphosphotransferase